MTSLVRQKPSYASFGIPRCSLLRLLAAVAMLSDTSSATTLTDLLRGSSLSEITQMDLNIDIDPLVIQVFN